MIRFRRRAIALLALLVCAALLLAGCSGSSSVTEAERLAGTAWRAASRTDAPRSVYVCQFTSPERLTANRELPDEMVCAIPANGYCFVFAPSDGGSFSGLQAVFMTGGGNVLCTADYNTLYQSYLTLMDDAQRALYLGACNYLAYLYMDAWDASVPLAPDCRADQWYALSDPMIEAMMKK